MCYWSTFRPGCPSHHVIIMQDALYGRMDPTVCYEEGNDEDYSHCTSNVLGLADILCSGRQQCNIDIPNEGFEGAMRCATKGYFEGSFNCLPGRITP